MESLLFSQQDSDAYQLQLRSSSGPISVLVMNQLTEDSPPPAKVPRIQDSASQSSSPTPVSSLAEGTRDVSSASAATDVKTSDKMTKSGTRASQSSEEDPSTSCETTG